MNQQTYPYTWNWHKWPRTTWSKGDNPNSRKGQRCRILCSGKGPGPRNGLVEFEDGEQVVVTHNAIRFALQRDWENKPVQPTKPQSMKCIFIRQPWAWLILHGGKDIENRDWPSRYRGWLLIGASKGCTKSEYSDAMDFCASRGVLCEMPPLNDLERGGIVGMVYMDGCVSESESPWFVGDYGFTLKNPQPMPFIPYRGQLGLFDVPTELLDQHWDEEKQEPETESGELLTEQLRQCIYRKDWTTYRILEHRIFEQIRDRLLQEVELAKEKARQSDQSDKLSLMHAAHWAVRFNLNLTTTIRYLERLGLCKQGAADSYKDRYKPGQATEILKKAEEEGAVPGELAV